MAMANVNNTLKSKDITLSTKVWTVKAVVFPVVIYRRENVRQNAKESTHLKFGTRGNC